jgi:hypothetical protein
MLSKYFKHAGLAALTLGCSLGLAQAQVRPTIAPPEPSALPRAATGATPNGAIAGTKALATGWNEEFCYASYWYNSGSVSYVYNLNQDGSSFYSSSTSYDLQASQNQLKNGCEHKSYWVYCPTSTCAWTYLYIYYDLQ